MKTVVKPFLNRKELNHVECTSSHISILLSLFFSLFIVITGCTPGKALIVLDKSFELFSEKTVKAYSSFNIFGYSEKIIHLKSPNAGGLALKLVSEEKPDLVLASPYLSSVIGNALSPDSKTILLSISSYPADYKSLQAIFQCEKAYKALGATLGRIVAEYQISHTDIAYCGVLSTENPNRPESWLDAFQKGYYETAPENSLEIISVKSNSRQEEFDNAVSQMERYNLVALFTIAPAFYGNYQQRFFDVFFAEDHGDFYYPLPVLPNSIQSSLYSRTKPVYYLYRDVQNAIKKLKESFPKTKDGIIPVPVKLKKMKGGNDYFIKNEKIEKIYESYQD